MSTQIDNVKNTIEELSPKTLLILWLGFLLAYRLLLTSQPYLPLFYDEAYYFHWSLDLSFGYYSKPPMVAWLIKLTTIFSSSDFFVKLSSPILYAMTSWIVFLIGEKLFNERTGIFSAAVFSTTLLVGFNSLFITTDAPLYFFWSIGIYVYIKCLSSNLLKHWVLLGIILGLGMLSKYTFALMPIGLVIHLLIKRRVDLLFSPGFITCVLLSLLIFSFNVYWNIQHEFVSVSHTQEIAKLDESIFHPDKLIEFLLAQCLLLGGYWIFILAKYRSTLRNTRYKESITLLYCFVLPILIVISTQAFLSRAFANWAGPFVIGASVLVGLLLSQNKLVHLFRGMAINLTMLVAFYHWPMILTLAQVEESKNNSPYYRVSGWKQVSHTVQDIADINDRTFLLSNSRDLVAYVGFYSSLPFNQLVFWNDSTTRIDNHYDLKNNINEDRYLDQDSYIFVSHNPIKENIKDTFKVSEHLGVASFDASKKINRTIYIYKLEGFRGYSHE